MNRGILDLHPAEDHFERHHRQRLAGFLTAEHEISVTIIVKGLHDLQRWR
jgi:hypothetical protein